MVKIFILANVTTELSFNLQRTVNIQMASFAAFSTFKSLVFFLPGVKDHRSDELFLISSIVEELVISIIGLVLFHRLRKLIVLSVLA